MKIFTKHTIRISRNLLLLAALLSIPFLFIATVFERAGGGTQKMKYLLLPLVCILAVFSYVLYRRKKDKESNRQSLLFLIIIEMVAALTSLTISCLTMYAMFTWNFELQFFLILLTLILISCIVMCDGINDFKIKRGN